MIPTSLILDHIHSHITQLALFDTVAIHHAADLPQALESLRHPSSKVCLLMPGPDTWEHTLIEASNLPLRAELRATITALVSHHNAAYTTTGTTAVLPLKDHLMRLLLWENCGLPGLLLLPSRCEPLRIEWDDAPATTAWQLEIEARQTLEADGD